MTYKVTISRGYGYGEMIFAVVVIVIRFETVHKILDPDCIFTVCVILSINGFRVVPSVINPFTVKF